jgi:hypothetical protein
MRETPHSVSTPPPPTPPAPHRSRFVSFVRVCLRTVCSGNSFRKGAAPFLVSLWGGRRTFSFPSHSPNCLSNFSWAYQKHLRIRFREYDLMTLECRNEADNAMSNFSLLCCMFSLNKFLFRLGVHSVNRRTMLGHCWACKRMSQKCFEFAK